MESSRVQPSLKYRSAMECGPSILVIILFYDGLYKIFAGKNLAFVFEFDPPLLILVSMVFNAGLALISASSYPGQLNNRGPSTRCSSLY